jgi:glutathione-regulated potassium-efflux system protein KefB
VLLADSEYRHEIESQIEPFKGLLLGLFFVGVGVSLDFTLAQNQPFAIGAIVVSMLLIKSAVLLALGKFYGKLDFEELLKLSVVLAGGGEFAFVVFNLAQTHSLLDPAQRDLLVVAVTISMALTPVITVGVGRWLATREHAPTRKFDDIADSSPRVIVAGYGRVGQIVARVLQTQRIPFTALETSVEQVDFVRRFNSKVYFGDASRPELLRAAGADKAEVFVLTTDDPEANLRTARIVKRLYPHLKIVARARNRQHVFRLMDLDMHTIVRDTFHSSLVMASATLEHLGIAPEIASDRISKFKAADEELLRTQYLVYDDDAALLQSAKDALADLDRLFAADMENEARERREIDQRVRE